MKRTITALAILASAASANALVGPGFGGPARPQPKPKTVCLYLGEAAEDGSQSVGNCDEKAKNKSRDREVLANGCAEGQVAMQIKGVTIPSCPTYIQL